VHDKLFVDGLAPFAPRREHGESSKEYLQHWLIGSQYLHAWNSRGIEGLPALAQASMEMLDAIVEDHIANASLAQRRLAYSMAVIRTVNFVVDPLQNQAFAQSILQLAESAGFPKWIVEIRHDATHARELPSIEMLRLAADSIMRWLQTIYWDQQKALFRDIELRMGKARKRATSSMSKLINLVSNEPVDFDKIDDEVDRILEFIKPAEARTSLLEELGNALCSSRKSEDFTNRWERVIAGIADAVEGLTGLLIEFMSQQVLSAQKEAAWKDVSLEWISYLISRRWHSMSDPSLSHFQGITVIEIHNSNWTHEQKAFMEAPAPAKNQDCPTIMACLKKAFRNPTKDGQNLIRIFLEAMAPDCPDIRVKIGARATELVKLYFGKGTSALGMKNESFHNLEDLETWLGVDDAYGTSELTSSEEEVQEEDNNEERVDFTGDFGQENPGEKRRRQEKIFEMAQKQLKML